MAAEPAPESSTEPSFEIGGLVVDQTVSRVGHLFYEELINGWDVPDYSGTVTVRERPDALAGNIVWVEVDDTILFQERMGTRVTGIEEKAELARKIVYNYVQMQKESLQQLEVY
ncbi:MAG: CsgE family curli-type amyloid fiber assembly protein [Porticoccaceae bacterium]